MRRGSSSILLNSPAQSPSQAPQPLPSSYPASTVSNESSDMHIYRTTSAPTPTRRIRFAPLPETATSDATDTPTRTESPHSVCTPSSPTPTASIASNPSKPTFKSNILRQLNIFKRSPLSSPTNSIDSSSNSNSNSNSTLTEDVASRLLRHPRTPDLSSSISRITSVAKRPSSAHGYKPRTSLNTLGSGGGRHSMSLNRSANSSTSPARTSVPKKSGIRMLNGRVYGSRPNPFDNIRDEPEFVEWGYGGMGSVTGSSNSKYSVLASGSAALLSDTHSQKVVAGTSRGGVAKAAEGRDDGDDGSGMNWVRKRREERERLAREKEAQERRSGAEARRSGETSRSSLDNPMPSSIDTDSRRTSMDGSFALDTDLSTLAASSAPTTPPSTTDALPLTSEEEQEHHILQAVMLTPKRHHFSHHKRPNAQVHLPENQDLVVGTTVGILGSDKDASPISESSSETDGQGELKDDDDDDEDSGSEQNEGQRKTSLGAGVEKISRHIEVIHKDGDR